MNKSMFGPVLTAGLPGIIHDLLEKLGGQKGLTWLRILKYILKLGTEGCLDCFRRSDTWLKINIAGKDVQDLILGPIFKEGIYLSPFAQRLCAQARPYISLDYEESNVEFVKGSLRELFCLVDNITLGNLLSKEWLSANGYDVCRPEDPFFLSVTYSNWLGREEVLIGMPPILVPDEEGKITSPYLFTIETGGPSAQFPFKHLGGRLAHANKACTPESIWTFRKLKKQVQQAENAS